MLCDILRAKNIMVFVYFILKHSHKNRLQNLHIQKFKIRFCYWCYRKVRFLKCFFFFFFFLFLHMDCRERWNTSTFCEVLLEYSGPVVLLGHVNFLPCEVHKEMEKCKFITHLFLDLPVAHSLGNSRTNFLFKKQLFLQLFSLMHPFTIYNDEQYLSLH